MYEIMRHRLIIQVQGEDSLVFLQKLITNDLNNSTCCYNYMLNNQGRYLFDFFIFRITDTNFFIDVQQEQAQQLLVKLQFYKLRAKVQITNGNEEYAVIYSKEVPNFLAIATARDPRNKLLGFRSIVNKNALPASLDNLYIADKYQFTIPDGYSDLIYEKSIPIEYGAEELAAISYTKGCYIGQEVISRTKYQGVVRKKIFKVIANSDLEHVEKGAAIICSNGAETIALGALCSSYKNTGIALIRTENYTNIHASASAIITLEGLEIRLEQAIWYGA